MQARIAAALKGRSVTEILALIIKNLLYPLRGLSPGLRRARKADGQFDRKWGTDTSGTRNLSSLAVDRDLALHGVRYQASDEQGLLTMLDDMGIDFSDFSFVDYGCGKGRILLSASLRPFRGVHGVEFSDELVAVAEDNLNLFSASAPIQAPVSIACGNAAQYAPPAGNLVCYFYNPFDESIMSQVVARLETALEAGGDIRIIYLDPEHSDLFRVSGRWQLQQRDDVLMARSGNPG
jgi:hypothetical protein